ncbi:CUE domain-containing protein 1 [Anopheles stephensi]|uniref:CUE domain-containing protein 1 n=1 Tax=Anopheles stephensi TaxID=30069 RepID=UPI001658A04D|nr:CUE domain-containing protein 1 [Anopheles stephensi]XP_035908235.1 CUE domain-containing protein 1 [Anopheles stephensi]
MASTMQLEFSQAMSDFKNMFPDMDRDVIEAVLRANQGAVDATIDQLLAMSTDNQNEKLRHELETDGSGLRSGSAINQANDRPLLDLTSDVPASGERSDHRFLSTSPNATASSIVAQQLGASPKVRKPPAAGSATGSATNSPRMHAGQQLRGDAAGAERSAGFSSTTATMNRRWNPPLVGPLPPTFLRLGGTTGGGTIGPDGTYRSTEFDLGDEQFAMMLQNEEFMAELRWNQEFLSALEKDHQGKVQDDAAFKERLRHMGKVSRKKFAQLARVFTWQRGGNKKASAVRHPDSLLLQEEHSDDEAEPKRVASGKK